MTKDEIDYLIETIEDAQRRARQGDIPLSEINTALASARTLEDNQDDD